MIWIVYLSFLFQRQDSLKKNIEAFDVDQLKPTEVKESNILPDKYDLLKEKIEDVLVQDVQSFDTSTLKTVTTYESSGIEIFKVMQMS